jgi:hypothetical protein
LVVTIGCMTFQVRPVSEMVGLEEVEHGQYRIRIEFYRLNDGKYFVWPYVRQVSGDNDIMRHFPIQGHFPEKDLARDAAVRRGKQLIDGGVSLAKLVGSPFQVG